MPTYKEKLAIALSNLAELKNKLVDVKSFLSNCESLIANLNIISSDIANEVNTKLSEKEYLDNQLSALKLNVKKEAEKLEQLKKDGLEEINKQKENFETIRTKEVKRLEAKENELNIKIKESATKQDVLNQKIAEADEFKKALEADLNKANAERKALKTKQDEINIRIQGIEFDEKENKKLKDENSLLINKIEDIKSSNEKVLSEIEEKHGMNESLLADIEKAKYELEALIKDSNAKLKTIEQNSVELKKLEALKIECSKIKKNLDDKDVNLKNYQKELENYANKIGYKK